MSLCRYWIFFIIFLKKEIVVNMYSLYLVQFLFEYNLYFFLFSLVLAVFIFYLTQSYNFIRNIKNDSNVYFIRFILCSSLLISFFVFCLVFWFFVKSYFTSLSLFLNNKSIMYFPSIFFYKIPLISFWEVKTSIEFFGFIFIILAYIVGVISFLSLDTRLYWKNIKFIFICNFLVLVIYMFVVVNDLILMFLFYEFMLIPSFLFVYYVSPYKRGVQASLYFLIWTQLGSLLVLSAVSYITYTSGSSSFYSLRSFNFTIDESWFLFFLLFFGFGFKVPIWPLQYWLTKTHVEAPAGFSIFLSGFLVKTAIYGFYKITNEFGAEIDTSFFSLFTIMGVADASMKMWGQIDLKKLVAYGTVQEMNLIYLAFLWGDAGSFAGGVLFCITHAFLSSLMFFLVDCIQKRYQSRSISELSGILHTTPNLGLSILFMHILYSGLPGTLKFLSEFYIFSGLISTAPITLVILLYSANFFGLIGFSKCWFNVCFGLRMAKLNNPVVDLTIKEFLIIFICIFSMFIFGFGFNIIV